MTSELAATENEIFPKPETEKKKMAIGNLMKWGEYLQKQRGGKKKKKELRRAMERLVSQRVRERRREGRISLGGKVSGPVGVSSRVQPLWLGEGRGGGERGEGGEAGNSLGQQQYGVCVD